MIFEVFMNDKDIIAFFENAGYETAYVEETKFENVYHNQTKEKQINVLKVVDENKKIHDAKDLLQKVMYLRNTTPDEQTIGHIKQVINNN